MFQIKIVNLKELHNLYAPPNIIREIKSRIRWAGHVACMGDMRNGYKIVRKHKGKRPHGRPRCRWEEDITCRWILGKQDGKVWSGFIWLRTRTNDRLL
jgi:hypothetical protein